MKDNHLETAMPKPLGRLQILSHYLNKLLEDDFGLIARLIVMMHELLSVLMSRHKRQE